MRGTNIGELVRRGEYCDICKKMIYINIWGHVSMHKQDLQRKEDRRAAKEASDNFLNRMCDFAEGRKCKQGFEEYKLGNYRSVEKFMQELEQELK